MRLILIIYLLGCCLYFEAQADTTAYYSDDTIIPQEEFPHYLGINATPMITSIVGNDDKDIKISAIYKYNKGDKNFRTSVNYITQSHYLPYDSYNVASSTDTSYNARFFSSNYKTFDVRLGIEELRGYRFSRLHIGADLILGYGEYNSSHFSKTFQLDSAGNYYLDSNIEAFDKGNTHGQYFDIGIDISFGFDWFMSDHFLFTFQLTPQLNYFILNNGYKNDPVDVLESPKNFPEFKIGFFDVYLVYKF